MTVTAESKEGLGSDFPGDAAQLALRLLLPAGRREEFVGDLIEEAETVVLPRRGRSAARRWFWWEAITSASPMHAHRCARDIGMHRQRWLVVMAILVLGSLMALADGARTTPALVVGLVSAAIVIPAVAGLLSGNLRIHAVAALAASVLLVAARLSSSAEFRWYAIPWIFYILLKLNWLYEHRREAARGDVS